MSGLSISQVKVKVISNCRFQMFAFIFTFVPFGTNPVYSAIAANLYQLSDQNNHSHKKQKDKLKKGHAIHYGVKSYFRGFLPFFCKSGLLTAAVRIGQISSTQKNDKIKQLKHLISVGTGVVGYALLYPLQIINLHMSVQVERDRFYNNARDCVSKIRRNDGIKSLYRGFLYSCALFVVQLTTVRYALGEVEKEATRRTEMERIMLVLGLIGCSQILFYPLQTVKKLYQINGSMGHTANNYSLSQTLRNSSLKNLFLGFSTRALNLSLFYVLFSTLMDHEEINE